ncbi:MAG: phage holin family protein [bacterium]
MLLLIHWLISGLAIIVAAFLLPGVAVAGFGTALIVAVVLGLLNIFLKPILTLLTLPVNILTLGLFSLVINAVIILLVSMVVPGFRVDGILAALLFSIVLCAVNLAFVLF